MADITEISAMVAAAGVLVGVAYYVLDMRNQTKIRRTDMLVRLYSRSTDSEFMDAFWKVMSMDAADYQDYVKKYGALSTDSPMNRAFFTTINFYQMAGVLLLRKLIDLVTVYDFWGSRNPTMLFEKVKPIVLELRREVDPALYTGFEYLCAELKRKEPQLKKTLNEALAKIQPQVKSVV
jgi:hypothetical protein